MDAIKVTRKLSRRAALCVAALLGGCGGASTAGAGGPLVLQASGGPGGTVRAEAFVIEPDSGGGQERTCATTMTAGTCQLTSCHLGGVGLVAPGHGNIGPLSATVGTTTVPLSYDGYGYPTVGFPASIALGTGDTMTFRGGSRLDAPWFEVSTRIPGVAVITSPAAAADGSAAMIDTSQDLPVTWVPISIGRITFGLDGGSWEIGGIALSMTCTFDGASGAGVVPRTLLASLKEMTGANPTYAVMGAALEATTVVGGRTIVTQSAQDSPTATRAFNVTLQ